MFCLDVHREQKECMEFIPSTTRVCICIKKDVYSMRTLSLCCNRVNQLPALCHSDYTENDTWVHGVVPTPCWLVVSCAFCPPWIHYSLNMIHHPKSLLSKPVRVPTDHPPTWFVKHPPALGVKTTLAPYSKVLMSTKRTLNIPWMKPSFSGIHSSHTKVKVRQNINFESTDPSF